MGGGGVAHCRRKEEEAGDVGDGDKSKECLSDVGLWKDNTTAPSTRQ